MGAGGTLQKCLHQQNRTAEALPLFVQNCFKWKVMTCASVLMCVWVKFRDRESLDKTETTYVSETLCLCAIACRSVSSQPWLHDTMTFWHVDGWWTVEVSTCYKKPTFVWLLTGLIGVTVTSWTAVWKSFMWYKRHNSINMLAISQMHPPGFWKAEVFGGANIILRICFNSYFILLLNTLLYRQWKQHVSRAVAAASAVHLCLHVFRLYWLFTHVLAALRAQHTVAVVTHIKC